MSFRSFLVTGGAGFVGCHLCEALIQLGHQVTVIDDLSTGRWKNIAHLEENGGFRGIVADAGDRELIDREVERHDFVYHLASAVGVEFIIEHPVETVENIVGTTEAVFDACARYRKPALLTSTSEVYGKSTTFPFSEENDVLLGPTSKRRWAYAYGKAMDEFLAFAHAAESGLPVHVVRLFNTVGPRQTGQYGMVIPSFVTQALRGEPITVYGDGTQRRCFCHVADVVEALVELPANEASAGQAVNIGSREEVTIRDLAERTKRVCDSDSEIVQIPYEEAYGPGYEDMPRRVPDLSRIKDVLGWKPTRDLDEILEDVKTYYQHEYDRD